MQRRKKVDMIESVLMYHERQTKVLAEGKLLYPLFPDCQPKKYTAEEEKDIISDKQQEIIVLLKERARKMNYNLHIPKREAVIGLFRHERSEIIEEIEIREKRLKNIFAKKADLTKYKKRLREKLYFNFKEDYYAFEDILPKIEKIIEEEAQKYYELLEMKEKELKNYIQIAEAKKKAIEENLDKEIKNNE